MVGLTCKCRQTCYNETMNKSSNYPAINTVWTDTKTKYASGDNRTVLVTNVRSMNGIAIFAATCNADGTRNESCKPHSYSLNEFNKRFTAA